MESPLLEQVHAVWDRDRLQPRAVAEGVMVDRHNGIGNQRGRDAHDQRVIAGADHGIAIYVCTSCCSFQMQAVCSLY